MSKHPVTEQPHSSSASVVPYDPKQAVFSQPYAPWGLERLKNTGFVVVRQQMDLDLERGLGASNTYKIWDVDDQLLFRVTEDSSCCCRWCCGPHRQLRMDVTCPSQEDLVLHLVRPACRWDCCCCFCVQKMHICDNEGEPLGFARQRECSLFTTTLDVLDKHNKMIAVIKGPCCPCRCCTDIKFEIHNWTGVKRIGSIEKKWGGDRPDRVNVDHEYFQISFPENMALKDKALLIGAAFLVNFMYFEMS